MLTIEAAVHAFDPCVAQRQIGHSSLLLFPAKLCQFKLPFIAAKSQGKCYYYHIILFGGFSRLNFIVLPNLSFLPAKLPEPRRPTQKFRQWRRERQTRGRIRHLGRVSRSPRTIDKMFKNNYCHFVELFELNKIAIVPAKFKYHQNVSFFSFWIINDLCIIWNIA
jgi:hypothetical protein